MPIGDYSVCSVCGDPFGSTIHWISDRNAEIRLAAHAFQSGASTPLTVEIKDDQLVIRIGIEVLAWAFEHKDENNPFDDAKNDFYQRAKVINLLEFAQDNIIAMRDEAEDGSSPLSNFLDEVAEKAYDDGSMAIEEDESGTSAWVKDIENEASTG